jgi:diphthine-ammonia ligase
MASSLNVIALISGGKDSFFSILHCQANGHTVVALANLYPAPSANGDEDINSYMYQTVGHSVIPLYEQAVGIPLYRQEITGTAVNSSRDYATPSQNQELDETEDLVPLLRRVISRHPEAIAVSTGAILSTYQRTRVESVALRLGLTPLSYLWQYPLLPPYTQSSLLHDMTAVGQKAIIIKTASGGLDEEFLGLDVADQRMITILGKAMGRYGDAGDGAILGEGGEFETLALDGPRSLWKKKIRIVNGPPGKLDGGQAVFKIKGSTLEEKGEDEEGTAGTLRKPELFDEEFKKILEATEDNRDNRPSVPDDVKLIKEPLTSLGMEISLRPPVADHLPRNSSSDTPTVFTYSNLTSDTRPTTAPGSPSRQLQKIFLRLDHILKQCHISKTRVNFCTLLLRDMTDFTVLNPVYAQYFSDVNPPARVTIAVGDTMLGGVDVMLSVVVDKDEIDKEGKIVKAVKRQGLHVQGRSYWAPANIGPYSQAISIQLPPSDERCEGDSSEIVYVAGQIPLIPASMEIYQERGFHGQALLSLQHLFRIGRAKNVKWWTAAVGFIPASAHPEDNVRIAQEMWKAVHTPPPPTNIDEDDEQEIDPWDQLNQHHGSTFNDNTYRSPIPDFGAVSSPDGESIPPCFIAQVASLPRGVDIEWSAMGLTSSSIDLCRHSTYTNVTTTAPVDTRSRFYTLEIREQDDLDTLGKLGVGEWSSATLYVGRGFDWNGKGSLRGMQWIPCHRVWGEGGREIKAVLVGRVDRQSRTNTDGGVMEEVADT